MYTDHSLLTSTKNCTSMGQFHIYILNTLNLTDAKVKKFLGMHYEILSKIMLFSFTVNFSSDLNRKWTLTVTNIYFRNFNRYNKI